MNKLKFIEKQINDCYANEQNSILEIGRKLEDIADSRCFKSEGYKSFNEYLESGRLPFPKSSASEYRKIYRVWKEKKVPLMRYGFNPQNGVRKLLHLDVVWRVVKNKEDLVEQMNSQTLREFELYVNKIIHESEPVPASDVVEMVKPSKINWDDELKIEKINPLLKTVPKVFLPILFNNRKIMEITFYEHSELKKEIEQSIKALLKEKVQK